jgi:Domain of unknown function (DUF4398)
MFARVSTAIIAAVWLSACGAPPNKEMDRAQGAIDAARAAGAERYAPEELKAAVAALDQSMDAVTQRDYRSALNFAVDSLERAQGAAKQAAEERAAVQSRAERALADMDALVERGEARVALAEAARVPRRTIVRVRAVLASARTAVQEARAAAERGEYAAAQRDLDVVKPKAVAAIEEIDRATAARPPRARR